MWNVVLTHDESGERQVAPVFSNQDPHDQLLLGVNRLRKVALDKGDRILNVQINASMDSVHVLIGHRQGQGEVGYGFTLTLEEIKP